MANQAWLDYESLIDLIIKASRQSYWRILSKCFLKHFDKILKILKRISALYFFGNFLFSANDQVMCEGMRVMWVYYLHFLR